MRKVIILLILFIALVGCNGQNDGQANQQNDIENVRINDEVAVVLDNDESESDMIDIGEDVVSADEIDPTEPPEPYARGLGKLEKANIDMAKRYFELTIKDFPDNSYKYNAKVMLGLIHLSESAALSAVSSKTHDGLERIGGRVDKDELDRIVQVFEDNREMTKEVDIEFLKIATDVLNHFEEFQMSIQELEYNYPIPSNRTGFANLEDLNFFAATGRNYPSETVINDIRRGTMEEMFAISVKDLYVSGKKLDFPFFFNYALSIVLYLENEDLVDIEGETDARDLAERLLTKIFKLTEDDPYHAVRVNLEADLELIDELLKK